MQNTNNDQYMKMSVTLELPFHWSVGSVLTRSLTELRDHGKLLANKCPNCARLMYPPKIVCPICHIAASEDFIQLSGKGKVIDYAIVVEGMMDPSTGQISTKPYPLGSVLMDEGVVILHYLEETDPDKLRDGMRVEVVLKPQNERIGAPWDIQFFREVKE